MKIGHLAGRILLGGFLLYSSITNLIGFKAAVGYAQAMGVPMPQVGTMIAMILLLIGGLSIITGYRPVIGIAAMTIFFLAVTPLMHAFWNMSDPIMSQINMRFFEANVGLLGASWMFLAIPQPWPYSLGSKTAQVRMDNMATVDAEGSS